ncbi:MAG: hypothetical protein PHI98_04925 [Eubacteriales bacterium]|nr:hypothetical protein [Eubacteriales bacterium]
MIEWKVKSAQPAEVCSMPEGFIYEPPTEQFDLKNDWLTWRKCQASLPLETAAICGFLSSRKAKCTSFEQVETHTQQEQFLFAKGISTMILLTSTKIPLYFSFPEGSSLIVFPGAAHYLGPSLTENALCIVVTSPKSTTSLFPLSEP